MVRRVSFSALESSSARLRLKIRRRPYSGPSLARGVALLYRRNKTNGTWVLKASDGHGKYWTQGFALADDFDDADAQNVLTFYQAQDQAKKLARGDDGSPGQCADHRRRCARRLQNRSHKGRCESLQRRLAALAASHQSARSQSRRHCSHPLS